MSEVGAPVPGFDSRAAEARLSFGRLAVRYVRSWVVAFAIAFAVLGPFRSAIADWYDVPSGSMEPTILPGDRIVANKLAYGLRFPFTFTWLAKWSEPKPGEIVILHSPKDGVRLVKRLVAGPGETVELRDNRVFINGNPLSYTALDEAKVGFEDHQVHRFATEQLGAHSHTVMATVGTTAMRSYGPLKIPEGQYFVMGDNRDNSGDSRYFGLVPRDKIVGRSSAVALSLDPVRSHLPRWNRFFLGLN